MSLVGIRVHPFENQKLMDGSKSFSPDEIVGRSTELHGTAAVSHAFCSALLPRFRFCANEEIRRAVGSWLIPRSIEKTSASLSKELLE